MLDKTSFGLAQESLRSGIYVVTSAHRRVTAGCTCVWVSRASFMPPLMAVSLATSRQTFDVVKTSSRLCINILGESQHELARMFGFNTGYEVDKFAGVPLRKGKSGAPIIESCAAYLDCKVQSIIEAGDHSIVLAEVIDAGQLSNERPAVYVAESFYAGTLLTHQAGATP